MCCRYKKRRNKIMTKYKKGTKVKWNFSVERTKRKGTITGKITGYSGSTPIVKTKSGQYYHPIAKLKKV